MINVTSALPIKVLSSICLNIGWDKTFTMSIAFFNHLCTERWGAKFSLLQLHLKEIRVSFLDSQRKLHSSGKD